jgi:hypothetical protein
MLVDVPLSQCGFANARRAIEVDQTRHDRSLRCRCPHEGRLNCSRPPDWRRDLARGRVAREETPTKWVSDLVIFDGELRQSTAIPRDPGSSVSAVGVTAST